MCGCSSFSNMGGGDCGCGGKSAYSSFSGNDQYGLTGYSNMEGEAATTEVATPETTLADKANTAISKTTSVLGSVQNFLNPKKPDYVYDADDKANQDQMLYLKIAGGIVALVLVVFVIKKLI